MAPKAPEQKGKKCPDDSEFPEDIRSLETAPFEVVWRPSVFITFFGNEEKGEEALETIKGGQLGHCFDLEELINTKTKDESLEREFERELSQWKDQNGDQAFEIPRKLAMKRANTNLLRVRDLLWKRELLRRRNQSEEDKTTIKDHNDSSKETQQDDVEKNMKLPFRAFPFIFVKGAETRSDTLLQMIFAGFSVTAFLQIGSRNVTDVQNQEDPPSLFEKVEGLVMSEPYGSPYSSVTAQRSDQPIEDTQQSVDALFSLATSAKGLLLSYNTFLSNSKIYTLDPSPTDDNDYQQEMQTIKEEQATIPRIINSILKQVCQFSDKDQEHDEHRMESSQFIHQMLRSVKDPEFLRDKNEDSHLLDCVFLHHNDEDRACECGLFTGCIEWSPWNPDDYYSTRIHNSLNNEYEETTGADSFSLQEVLELILNALPKKVQDEQESNFKTRRHLEYLNPVVLEQVRRHCDHSDMMCYKLKLLESRWYALVYLHDLDKGSIPTQTDFNIPPTLQQFSMEPEKHQEPFYDLRDHRVRKEDEVLEELYPEDVFVKSNASSFTLTKDDVCFSFQRSKESEKRRLTLTYKTQTIISFCLSSSIDEQQLEMVFTRADGTSFAISEKGRSRVIKTARSSCPFTNQLDTIREANWFEIDPEGFIVMHQGSNPSKLLFNHGGLWNPSEVDGIAGGLYTDRHGKRFFHLLKAENKEEEEEGLNEEAWFALEALEISCSDLTEQGGHQTATREDLFISEEFPDGSVSFTLSNGVSIKKQASGNWSIALSPDIPQIYISKEEVCFDPCPGFSLKLNLLEQAFSVALANDMRVIAKGGIVVTNAACRSREKRITELTDVLQRLLEHAASHESSTPLEAGLCSADGVLFCDLKQGQCALRHDKEWRSYDQDMGKCEEGEDRYFDPTWTDPKVFVLSPFGDGFEILSYSKTVQYLADTSENSKEICTESYEQDTVYMDTFLLPKGSKKHLVLQGYSTDDKNHQEETSSRIDAPEIAVPSLKRPSALIYGQVNVQETGLLKSTSESPSSTPPVVLFREIIETTLPRDEANHLHPQDDTQQMNPDPLVSCCYEDPAVRYIKSLLEAKERSRKENEQMEQAKESLKKQWQPWPIKEGPFDHCPKVPEPGKLLNYFQTEEGLIALESYIDPQRQKQKTTGTNKVKTSSAGSSLCRGVYLQEPNRRNEETTEITLSPSSIDFGEVPFGESVHGKLLLSNLTPTPTRFALPTPNPPLSLHATLGPIAAGMSRVIEVSFKAKNEGKHNGEVWIRSELKTLKFTYSAMVVKVQ